MENVLSLEIFSSCLIYPCFVSRFICDKIMSFDKTGNFEWIKRKYNWKLKSFVLGMVAHTYSPSTQWRQKDCQEFQISQDYLVISRPTTVGLRMDPKPSQTLGKQSILPLSYIPIGVRETLRTNTTIT